MTPSTQQASANVTLRVGLTGGIASGKSLVTHILKQHNVPTVDADAIVHELYANDAQLKQEIKDAFGVDVFTASGDVDRKKLGDIVFNDRTKLAQLSGFIHPKVRKKIEEFFEQHKNEKLAVADIPLLFESGLEKFYDAVWLVKASREQQLERLMKRNSLTKTEAEQRLTSQMSFEDKLKKAQQKSYNIIDNTGSKEATEKQVAALVLNIKA